MKVIGCCAYFADSLIHNIVPELQAAGVQLHLWALQHSSVELSQTTRGYGMHPKWAIMNHLMASVTKDFDYIIFFDDDIVLPANFCRDYFTAVQMAEAELSQPALTHDSYFSHKITLQDPTCAARLTNFVEIGPLVCMTQKFYRLAEPHHDPISPLGWGYEAQWSHIGRVHKLPLAIVDCCAVRHARPVGRTYSKATSYQQMQAYLQKYGNPMPTPTVLKRLP